LKFKFVNLSVSSLQYKFCLLLSHTFISFNHAVDRVVFVIYVIFGCLATNNIDYVKAAVDLPCVTYVPSFSGNFTVDF